MALTMEQSVKRFNKEIKRELKERLIQNAARFQKTIAMRVLRGVIKLTPVDTGRARANWQVGVDKRPVSIVPPPIDIADDANINEKTLAEDTFKKGSNELEVLTVLRQVVWIVNNVPYASELEHGSSQQNPEGMVRKTMARVARFSKETGKSL